MRALLTGILSQFWPYVVGAIGGLLGFIALWLRQSGKKAERAKQAEREAKARDIADQVDNDVGAMPPADAREELKKWSK